MKGQGSVLTIGGFDPVGHTGVSADRSALLALGYKPVNAISGVFISDGEIEPVDALILEHQLKAFGDFNRIQGVKTGLLATRENIEATATYFEDNKAQLHNLVVDVYLETEDESALLSSTAISLLKMRLLPLATLAIAYLSEAERLAGQPVGGIDQMKEAAEAVRMYGPKLVLIKADHPVDEEMVDILYDGTEHQFLFTKNGKPAPPRQRRDVLASAVAASLCKGYRVKEAVEAAKQFALATHPIGQAEPA